MKKISLVMAISITLLLSACTMNTESSDTDAQQEKSGVYAQITSAEAMKMLEEESDYLIVDVRTAEEYAEGHIPDAINVPNETIGDLAEESLPDKEQKLFVYCRSGNRSKQASQVLADLGYTNVYEMGGMIDWTGEVVSEK